MTFYSHQCSGFGSSLFERLDSNAPIRAVTQGPDPKEILASIKRNISHLLNTRVGDSLSAPDLGLIDFNDAAMAGNELEFHIRWALRDCLEKYEPRISNIDIRLVSNSAMPLELHFYLQASINVGALFQQIQLNLFLDKSKQYRVI